MEEHNNASAFICVLISTVILLMVNLTQAASKEQTQVHISDLKFYSTDNRALKNGAYSVQDGVQSHVQCVRNCHIDAKCISVNYIETKLICELNKASRAEYPDELLKDCESMYFDAEESTRRLPALQQCSCLDLLKDGQTESGEYYISPPSISKGLKVYCDMETDNGGWIVIQRRIDGEVAFNRNWLDYQDGFGQASREFWLGNENLRKLTESSGKWQLRVELLDWDGSTRWSGYNQFSVSRDKYRLTCTEYDERSTAGDSMRLHNGMLFSTKDQDNDVNDNAHCAVVRPGGWWYYRCVQANPNGQYFDYEDRNIPTTSGSGWGII
ncbi:fibrinogen-like protein A [Asterias amurensis]|uniref:fibrinogen-like protein A n=1 Tax=Asterias amurensis TaxID=7602 RepID=UPI003AB1C333